MLSRCSGEGQRRQVVRPGRGVEFYFTPPFLMSKALTQSAVINEDTIF
jgi:hypothetical protein